MKLRLADWFWLAAYLATVAAVAGLVFKARTNLLAIYSTEEAQAEWTKWRTGARDMATGSGPVKRRQPQSIEPPALVLMRDYFATCLALSLLLSTVLFGTFMFFLRGALQCRSLTPSATGGGAESTRPSSPDGVGGLR